MGDLCEHRLWFQGNLFKYLEIRSQAVFISTTRPVQVPSFLGRGTAIAFPYPTHLLSNQISIMWLKQSSKKYKSYFSLLHTPFNSSKLFSEKQTLGTVFLFATSPLTIVPPLLGATLDVFQILKLPCIFCLRVFAYVLPRPTLLSG